MTSTRFYPRYAGKDGFEERYVVVDSRTGEELSPPKPYHLANNEAGARNEGNYVPTALAEALIDWLPGTHIRP